ncbi:hypothetical protein BP6252_01671 [Coleophoma cylindrospora]|uniref:RRM domain-containing protein n=1 Tax=Coleophoma cylindrospora TaxID=1849047 RepID=A0A3D8STK9_9HELO|nr:hypothetical protein BP6252_01671 [Coleophoma cylindrospora]
MSSGTVTIEKAYFETLLRRAQFHISGVDFTTPVDLLTVNIPKLDHDGLLNIARQYENLRRNLYRGGITEDMLALLIKDDNETQNKTSHNSTTTNDNTTSDGDAFRTQPSFMAHEPGRSDTKYDLNYLSTPRNGFNGVVHEGQTSGYGSRRHSHEEDYTFDENGIDDGHFEEDSGQDNWRTHARPTLEKFCQRTIQISKLPEGVTHSDITDAVRGGMLLEIYLRAQDRIANISFLNATDAQGFFHYVKRHDLYVRGKRVEVRWSDRQFILPGHIAHKVSIGATRNLVIRNSNPRHTEKMVRDDLEHIHNLVVIKVTFIGQDMQISTNSIHNAMFARTCMMSRAVYKGLRIEWDNDDCAAPLARPEHASRKPSPPARKKATPPNNRFELLELDGSEDGSQKGRESNDIKFGTSTIQAIGA